MSVTTPTPRIATITTNLGRWLATVPLEALEALFGIDIHAGVAPRVQLQITGHGALRSLALWAEHLDQPVTLIPASDERCYDAEICVRMGTTRVELWSHLEGDVSDGLADLLWLRDRTGIPDDDRTVTAEFLREAADQV